MLPKLTATSTNATLTDKDNPVTLSPIEFPAPSFSVIDSYGSQPA